MDTQELKARSIELAERAYRLKKLANGAQNRQVIDDTADELIRVDNPQRFHVAQSKLELKNIWPEELRSLAHEINVADHSLKGTSPLSSEEAYKILEQWAQVYTQSQQHEVIQTGFNILNAVESLASADAAKTRKESFNYLITLIETMMARVQLTIKDDFASNASIDLLRNIRDAVLMEREMVVDDAELLDADQVDDNQVADIQLARKSLDEIYKTIEPVNLNQ